MRVNIDVQTPNGNGVTQGNTEDGVLVRHDITEMTGKLAGKCWTPKAHSSGIWEYKENELCQISRPTSTST